MKNYLITLFILLTPVFSIANTSGTYKKKAYLFNEAEKHRLDAQKCLKSAEEMSLLIPILEDRKNMQILIGSIAVTLVHPDPTVKARLLTIGLPLLASISGDLYDKFCDYRLLLVKIDYHVEMVRFYEKVSIKYTSLSTNEQDVQAFFQAMDCLSYCQILAFSTEDRIGKDVIYLSKKLRSDMMDEFARHRYKVSKQMIENAWKFYEDMSKMLAKSKDNILVDKLFYNIRETIMNLELSERISKRMKKESEKKSDSVHFIVG